MDLIKWDSFIPKNLFEGFPSLDITGWDLAADVYEKDGAVIVQMQVPGIDTEKYNLFVKDGQLHVSGSREKETEVEDKDYYRREIHRGCFERSIPLPDVPLRTDALSVSQNKGELKISIPKA